MLISENLIIGDSIAHMADDILGAVRSKEVCKYIVWYAITTALEGENLLYLISGVEMNHKIYYDSDIKLLALAGSRKEALDIVLNLVQEGYNKGDIHCMKQYLESI
ncbi:MAG: hypothetical protein LUF92_03515 [Clostridiales bacterium]|nr:hypothetical protein [Clostridiales bacterium]